MFEQRGVVFSVKGINSDPTIGGTGATKFTTTGTLGAFSVGLGMTVVGTLIPLVAARTVRSRRKR